MRLTRKTYSYATSSTNRMPDETTYCYSAWVPYGWHFTLTLTMWRPIGCQGAHQSPGRWP